MRARFALYVALFSLVTGVGCSKQENALELPANAEPAPASSVAVPTNAGPSGGWTAPAGSASGRASPLSGTTEAHRKSTLTPKVSSPVTTVYVRDGDVVKAGQLLVSLDTRDFALRTQQAEANLDAAKVNVDSSQLEWNRLKGLVDEKAVPQAQFDQIDARLKGARANLAQAETAVAMAKKALSDASIAAPFNAIVVKRHVNEGEYATMMPATPLVTIEEIDPIDLRIQVPSSDMDRVHLGDSVRVRFPANGSQATGKISRIVPANDPRTRTFSAIVELPNPTHALRTGLYAEVDLGSTAAPSAPAKATPAPGAPAQAAAASTTARVTAPKGPAPSADQKSVAQVQGAVAPAAARSAQ